MRAQVTLDFKCKVVLDINGVVNLEAAISNAQRVLHKIDTLVFQPSLKFPEGIAVKVVQLVLPETIPSATEAHLLKE
jgi:hypothetical protein